MVEQLREIADMVRRRALPTEKIAEQTAADMDQEALRLYADGKIPWNFNIDKQPLQPTYKNYLEK